MDDDSGGFLLSPPASSVTTTASHGLPHRRTKPLRPGGAKWSTFIRYVDSRILHIQRRFAKRTTPISDSLSNVAREDADVWGDVKGYSLMKTACSDIRDLVKIVWASGTPSLQIPYLINLGNLVGNVVAGMPPSPKSLFSLLNLFDQAFASLLQGRDIETGESLPGLEGTRGVSVTEKVRIRSLVERTRVGVMESFKRGEFDNEAVACEDDDVATQDEEELIIEGASQLDFNEDDDSWDMSLARVYDRTVVELGDSLEQPDLGIITEGVW